MKKLLLLFLVALSSLSIHAQTEPNRLLVVNKAGSYDGFVIDRIDSLVFRTVDGEVKADVEFLGYSKNDRGEDVVRCSVTRSAACKSFKIMLTSKTMADAYNSEMLLASYVDKNVSTVYSQDFTNAEMTGFDFDFQANTLYTILTVGLDEFGVACDVSRADFATPAASLVGNPSVEWNLTENTPRAFKLTVTPNADCSGYYVCRFEAGTAEQQYQQWAAFMQFQNMGDMVKSWSGRMYSTTTEHVWDDCSPLTDYEVYILPVDVNGEYGSMVIARVTTAAQGGSGTAEVTITIGEFGGDSNTGYWQKVTYTPNDQTLLFRDMIVTKAAYDSEFGDEGILEYLKQDLQYMGWNQYATDEAQWNAEPNTDYIAFAIAQNADKQWGPLSRVDFSTPSAPASAMKKAAVSKRITAPTVVKGASAPALKQPVGLQMIEK